jgi:hypothetical protein
MNACPNSETGPSWGEFRDEFKLSAPVPDQHHRIWPARTEIVLLRNMYGCVWYCGRDALVLNKLAGP